MHEIFKQKLFFVHSFFLLNEELYLEPKSRYAMMFDKHRPMFFKHLPLVYTNASLLYLLLYFNGDTPVIFLNTSRKAFTSE